MTFSSLPTFYSLIIHHVFSEGWYRERVLILKSSIPVSSVLCTWLRQKKAFAVYFLFSHIRTLMGSNTSQSAGGCSDLFKQIGFHFQGRLSGRCSALSLHLTAECTRDEQRSRLISASPPRLGPSDWRGGEKIIFKKLFMHHKQWQWWISAVTSNMTHLSLSLGFTATREGRERLNLYQITRNMHSIK